MLIPRIVYDSSCNYHNDSQYSSIQSNSLFDLSKNFLFVLADNIVDSNIGKVIVKTEDNTHCE